MHGGGGGGILVVLRLVMTSRLCPERYLRRALGTGQNLSLSRALSIQDTHCSCTCSPAITAGLQHSVCVCVLCVCDH